MKILNRKNSYFPHFSSSFQNLNNNKNKLSFDEEEKSIYINLKIIAS